MLTGKKVLMPVRTVAVEENGEVTDVSDYTDCSSTDEDILKVGALLCLIPSRSNDALLNLFLLCLVLFFSMYCNLGLHLFFLNGQFQQGQGKVYVGCWCQSLQLKSSSKLSHLSEPISWPVSYMYYHKLCSQNPEYEQISLWSTGT